MFDSIIKENAHRVMNWWTLCILALACHLSTSFVLVWSQSFKLKTCTTSVSRVFRLRGMRSRLPDCGNRTYTMLTRLPSLIKMPRTKRGNPPSSRVGRHTSICGVALLTRSLFCLLEVRFFWHLLCPLNHVV